MFRLAVIALFCHALPVTHAQLIVAHRGASHDAPENTLAAFNLAWEQGADAIEGDFQLTADGRIVAMHDKTLKRTAGLDRKVADLTLAELQKLEAGRWKHAKFVGEPIPTIEQVLATVPDGRGILIELKTGVEIVAPLKAVLDETKLKPSQLTIICFDADVIAACKKHMPHITAFWLTGFRQDKQTKQWSPTIGTILETLKRTKADGLDCNAHKSIDAAFVKRLRETGMQFHCWTVNDVDVAKRFGELGVDSITTDRPAWLRERLAKVEHE